MSPTIERAYALLHVDRRAEALASLEAGGNAGQAACWVELAVWYLEGRVVSRDLARAREYFRRAGDCGHQKARMAHLSFVASGTGGESDWHQGVKLLRAMASESLEAARQVELVEKMQLRETGDPISLPHSKTISERPWVRLFPAFLSIEECQYLIATAEPSFMPALVVDPRGRMAPHPIRTSECAGFPLVSETPFIHAINRRIAAASGTDVAAGEPLQVLRYRPGQEYRPHSDALPSTENQRILTMLVYLNSGYGGGETRFLATGLTIRGRTGDAILFRNTDPHGMPEPTAEHAGLPVTSGEKLLASRWIRQRRFLPS